MRLEIVDLPASSVLSTHGLDVAVIDLDTDEVMAAFADAEDAEAYLKSKGVSEHRDRLYEKADGPEDEPIRFLVPERPGPVSYVREDEI